MKNIKNLSLIFTLALLFTFCKTKSGSASSSADVENITISFVSTSDYCGGANPPEDILAALKTSRPAANMDLVLMKKGNPKLVEIKTDAEGKAEIENLESGSYKVLFADKLNAKAADKSYEAICKTWKETANGTFSLKEGQTSVEVSIHKTCNPCNEPAQ